MIYFSDYAYIFWLLLSEVFQYVFLVSFFMIPLYMLIKLFMRFVW